MPTTLRNTDILFNDSTTQSTAAPKLARINTFTTSQTYTTPAGCTGLMIFAVGAHGGRVAGYNFSTDTFINIGGQGGTGYAEKFISSPAASYVITIGAGGAAGGGAGGATTVDTISIAASSPQINSLSGQAGGVASGGTFNANGGAGGSCASVNPPSGIRSGGGGGAGGSRAGAGFAGGNGNNFGSLNNPYGGGGGGGGSGGAGVTSTNNIGGAGGAAAATASASAVTVGQYFTPAGAAGIFPAGSPGLNSPGGNTGGQGGFGAPGIDPLYTSGAFQVIMIRGRGGPANQITEAQAGEPGIVQIWEFF